MAATNCPPHPVSVAGRAGRVSQTRVRPWQAMGRQRFSGREGHRLPDVVPQGCATLLLFQIILPTCERPSHRISHYIPQAILAPASSQEGLGRPGYIAAVTVSNLSDPLSLSASDRLSYQFHHITQASTHTLSQIGLIPCCRTTSPGPRAEVEDLSALTQVHNMSSPSCCDPPCGNGYCTQRVYIV